MKTAKRTRRDAKQLFRLCFADDSLDENRVRQVVQRVGQAGHSSRLAILSHFQRLVRMHWDQHTATVESATPMPQDFQVGIQARLLQVYGPELSTSFALSPALIGGMRIKVGSDVYDASVQAKLAALEAGL